MPRGIKKEKLPSKVCVVCNRPFTWRKQWERVQWNEVTTCSKSCNNKRRQENRREKETDRGIHVHESWLCLNEEENRETATGVEFRDVSGNLPNTEVQEEGWNSTEFCTEEGRYFNLQYFTSACISRVTITGRCFLCQLYLKEK
jgi:hypothetical protein